MSSTSSGSSISSSSDSSSSSGGGGSVSPISSTASGFLVKGTIQTGNNAPDGDPEYSLSGSIGSTSDGQAIWDSDLSDGFDSTNTPFELTADLSGSDGVTLGVDHVNTNGIISASLASSGFISRVQVAAQAQSGGRFRYSSLRVDFFRGGTLVQTISVGADVLSDADGTGGEDAFQGVEVTPNSSNYDNVHVSGVFQITDPTPNTLPDASGLILIFS